MAQITTASFLNILWLPFAVLAAQSCCSQAQAAVQGYKCFYVFGRSRVLVKQARSVLCIDFRQRKVGVKHYLIDPVFLLRRELTPQGGWGFNGAALIKLLTKSVSWLSAGL